MSHYQIRDSDAATNHHPVDDMEPIECERSMLAEALVRVVHWTIKTDEPTHIGARVMVLANALSIDNVSYADIGRECGISREGVRLMAKELETQFGLRAANSRSDTTRGRCRASRLEVVKQKELGL